MAILASLGTRRRRFRKGLHGLGDDPVQAPGQMHPVSVSPRVAAKDESVIGDGLRHLMYAGIAFGLFRLLGGK